ncbi:MAG: hypothetical protein RL325_484 [Planctomycetota bacterium]
MIACFDASMGACLDMGGRKGAASGGGKKEGKAPKTAEGHDAAATGSVGPVRIERDEPAERFALGAPCVVPTGAPHPAAHPAGKPDGEIRALFAAKARHREEGIRRVVEDARSRGQVIERFVAAIRYDTELAPHTTNRRQLLELGIEVPAADSLPAEAAAVHRVLWTIIYGLARLGIFLTGTDGLDDRELLERLCTRILVDEVSDVPPSADMSEFIDLCVPDGLTGPFEASEDPDDEPGEILRNEPPAKADRDRLLPRPDRR